MNEVLHYLVTVEQYCRSEQSNASYKKTVDNFVIVTPEQYARIKAILEEKNV